jgi:hypothetical protein
MKMVMAVSLPLKATPPPPTIPDTHFCWGHAVVLFEALRYKPEGRGIDSRCCHWIFSLT